jgi:hypothetical protein
VAQLLLLKLHLRTQRPACVTRLLEGSKLMPTRYWALISGIAFLAVGLLAFVPSLTPLPVGPPPIAVDTGYGFLFGIFPVNLLHNLVHLVVGVLGILAYRSFSAARLYARGLAICYAVLTIMGFIPVLSTFFGLIPIFGADIGLHALTAIISAYFGWLAPISAHERSTVARV